MKNVTLHQEHIVVLLFHLHMAVSLLNDNKARYTLADASVYPKIGGFLMKNNKKKVTTRGVPKLSPIQVLPALNVA